VLSRAPEAEYGSILDKISSALDFPTLPFGDVNVRATDPKTSKLASQSVAFRSGSQKAKLLAVYAEASDEGLTDEQAGVSSGLAKMPKCCYWKRCSELRQAGLIEVNGKMRRSSVGEQQQVCIITSAGLELLNKI
jgi:hypothetical protein